MFFLLILGLAVARHFASKGQLVDHEDCGNLPPDTKVSLVVVPLEKHVSR